MSSKMPNFAFNMMADVGLPIRNFFMPPRRLLEEVAVPPGGKVLDYGCGPGAYTFLLADAVGGAGMVYALDVHPFALQRIEQGKRRGGYANVRTILSDCGTSLPDSELDRVILFDVFHLLADPQGVLRELHRVLKPDGILCFSDHHMQEDDILACLKQSGLFTLMAKGGNTYQFYKA
jgi:ubiquinone/menaquinone biosynthesis C-methylase UbiE